MYKINLLNGDYLCYGRGSFDAWCVFHINVYGKKNVPKDIHYFTELYKFSQYIDSNKIYDDIVKIYNLTSKYFDERVVNVIRNISKDYDEYQSDFFRIFSIIYMTMISEENKKNTKLGKRIKRLGIHYLLINKETPQYCANFMRNMDSNEISKLCEKCGF